MPHKNTLHTSIDQLAFRAGISTNAIKRSCKAAGIQVLTGAEYDVIDTRELAKHGEAFADAVRTFQEQARRAEHVARERRSQLSLDI